MILALVVHPWVIAPMTTTPTYQATIEELEATLGIVPDVLETLPEGD